MKIISLLVTLLVVHLSFDLFAQSNEQKTVPRDTSFTPFQAWMNINKQFPPARIVMPVLPEGIVSLPDLVYTTLPGTVCGNTLLSIIGENVDKTIITFDDYFDKKWYYSDL